MAQGPPDPTPGPVDPTPIGATAPGALLRRYGIDPWIYNEHGNLVPQTIVSNTTPNPRILDKVAREARELFLEAASIGDAEPYAFGTVACKPLIVAADDSGDTLVLDCLWSVGECESVCNAPVSGNSIWSPDIGFLSVSGAGFEHFTGTSGQSASTIMTALKGSYDTLPDRAHSVISMQDTWNLNFLGFVSGVKVIDPRNSPQTKVFSENPPLILADIFARSGYTIDWDSFAEAANYADTPTHPTGSPMDPRWAIRGHITTKQELRHWVHALAQYAGCYIDVRGGTVICVVDKPRASNHTVTASDKSIVDGTTRLKRRGSKNAPEKVTINVLAPGGSTWAASYGTSGGAGTETTLFMPYWESIHPAGLKAKEIYLRNQHEIESFEFISRDHSLIRTLGDVGTITYAPAGLSAVEMALVENEPVERGRWRRKYIPYHASDYPADNTGATTATASETVRNPYFPPQGPTPVLSFDTVTADSPNWQRIKIDFSPQTWAYLKDYLVTVTTTADEETILYSEYIAKGSETGSPETITTYTDFPTDFTDSPENVYRVNVYLRSNVSDGLNDVLGAPGTADIDSPPAILWDTDPITLWYPTETFSANPEIRFRTESTDGLGVSVARYDYINFPNGNEWLEFEPFVEGDYSSGEYLVKYAITSLVSGGGDVLINNSSGTPGQWYDADSLKISLSDTASPASREHVVLDVTVAADNGAGAPVAGTEVTKPVTIIGYQGAYGYTVEDTFTGSSGTNLTAHTPDTDSVGGGWVIHAGFFSLNGIGKVDSVGNSRAVIDAGTADCAVMAEVQFASKNAGLIGRAQDANNYWELFVEDASSSDPVLKLNEVVAGTPTTRASVTMTGEGPFNSLSDRPLRLMFDGNDIYGYCKNEHSLTRYEVSFTSTSFNTETLFGIHSTNANTQWDEFHITTAEIGLIT